MKKLVLTFSAIIIFSGIILPQTDITGAFNSTDSGRSIIFTVSKTFNNKNEVGGGIRFNINKLAHSDDQGNIYKKRLYATEWFHHLGINVFYHRKILHKWKHVKPFVFYDLQVTYSTTRNRMLIPKMYDNDGNVLYREYIEFFGPFTWVEQNIGIGFKAVLFDGLFIQQKFGMGTSFILGYEEKLWNKYFHWFDWEFGYIINIGIGYRFGTKKNK